MPTPSTRPPSSSSGATSADGDVSIAGFRPGDAAGPDPELLALPPPPKGERTWTVLLLLATAVASVAMIVALARDAAYGLSGDVARGEACASEITAASMDVLAPQSNHFACGRARLGAAGGVRFERPFTSDGFRVLPALGRQDLWVELRVPMEQENGRFVPPNFVQGRLVRFDEAGIRHRGLAAAIEATSQTKIPANALLLVMDEEPRHARWALVLVVLFAAFFGWNVVSVARLVRRVR
ncbi:MAG: hypothetical protein U0169_02405 [Polyangiaceae bacterium]